MKKIIAMLLAVVMLLGLCACAKTEEPAPTTAAPTEAAPAETTAAPTEAEEEDYFTKLIADAQAEGELVIYGSCEDPYIAAAADAFAAKYNIKTSWQRLTGGEVQAKIEEENGNPSADVWFGGTSDPQAVCASKGLLMQYDAQNAVNLMSDMYRDADGYWYGIYTGIMGFF